ncbi:MAG TPA: tRNA (adenosine(37)-N6)-threonylcarbamoyltransferase complex dimerization subunit type 1 TsaB [Terriglobales bacterium]|nr:tRNA (adenosine(37)-N6)-threonylcarbamoyltransferase complex dimerization subunit type 1 TsaB [Terriglobales bacterium]
MLILAIDTAHKNGSIALAEGTESDFKVLGIALVDGGAFSAQLVPRIAQLLSKHGFNKSDIAGFALSVGPGSFTGLRIGLAGVKGLVEVLRKPIAAVSSLEALASLAPGTTGNVFALLDAGRAEFYVGEYQASSTGLRKVREELATLSGLAAMVSGRQVVVSEQKVFNAAMSAGASATLVPEVGSDTIARLGWQKLTRQETVTSDELDANYLRRDETLFSK